MNMPLLGISRRSFVLSTGAGILTASGILSAWGQEPEKTVTFPESVEHTPEVKAFEQEVKAFGEKFAAEDGEVYPRAEIRSKDPIDVLIMVRRFSFEPGSLKLDRNTPYRFIIMAADIPHGFWVKPGSEGPITLAAGKRYEHVFTFRKPGRAFITCSTYCGAEHDKMRAMLQIV